MAKGGRREWEPCDGSYSRASRTIDSETGPMFGTCSVCGRSVATYKDGRVVRHKRKEG